MGLYLIEILERINDNVVRSSSIHSLSSFITSYIQHYTYYLVLCYDYVHVIMLISGLN